LGPEYEVGTQYNTFCDDYNGANLLNLGRPENREMLNLHSYSKKTHPGLLLEGITSLMAQQAQYDKEQDALRKEEEKAKQEEQKLLEIEKQKIEAKDKADAPARELVAQLEAFQRENPAEADWRKNNWRMEYWKPMHVYDWLKNSKEKQIVKFADAIGRRKMDGLRLVQFVQNDEAAATDATMLVTLSENTKSKSLTQPHVGIWGGICDQRILQGPENCERNDRPQPKERER